MIYIFFIIIILVIIISHLSSEEKVQIYNINEKFNNEYNIWSKVIDNKYYIKIKPLTLDDYSKWKDYINSTNIVDNIYFDPNIEELIISSNDEDVSIILAYTIINNFNEVKFWCTYIRLC